MRKKVKKNKWYHLAAFLLVPMLMGGCKSTEVDVPELIDPVDQAVDMAYAERRDVYNVTTWESAVIPYMEELAFPSTGILKELYVTIGDDVKEGDILAELENTDNNSYDSLMDELKDLRSRNAERNRLAELDIEMMELMGSDTSEAELKLKQQKEIQVMEEAHLLDKIALVKDEPLVNEVVAPFDGNIVAIADMTNGAVSENSPVIAIAKYESDKYLIGEYLNAEKMSQSERIYAIVAGKEYELLPIPYDSKTLQEKSQNGSTLVSTYQIIGGDDIDFGDYAIICQISNFRENVISVPYHAIYSEGSQKYVYVIQGETRIKTPVVLGVNGSMYVEVLEGLEEGACVYVRN